MQPQLLADKVAALAVCDAFCLSKAVYRWISGADAQQPSRFPHKKFLTKQFLSNLQRSSSSIAQPPYVLTNRWDRN